MIERETGDVYVYEGVRTLRLLVEEFWDVLDREFEFFAADGRRLKFGEDFIRGDDQAIIQEEEDTKSLREALGRYALTHGMRWFPDGPIEAFIHLYAQQRP